MVPQVLPLFVLHPWKLERYDVSELILGILICDNKFLSFCKSNKWKLLGGVGYVGRPEPAAVSRYRSRR